jgi:hypothetical protein
MPGPPLILADADRAGQFLLIGRSRKLLDGYGQHTDGDGIVWATKAVAGHGFAVTWLGPGWVFDPFAQQRRAEELRARRAEMAAASPERHRRELEAVIARVRLGTTAERLLWLIHQQVLRRRLSVLHLPDCLLAEAVWAGRERPAHWRQEVLAVLRGLTWLHLTDGEVGESAVPGADTVVLTHAADLRGTDNDACQEACASPLDRPHHHYLINVGRGFLGILEGFARAEDDNGVRSYAFPVGGKHKQSSSLRAAGKSGRLVTVYLPAKLGDRTVCEALTLPQHRLLQAIVRETTRETKQDRQSVSEAEVLHGNAIPTTDGKGNFACNLLDPEGAYVGFNGNKLLKGRGYRLLSQDGWLARAGYSPGEVSAFLADLSILADTLSLVPVAIDPQNLACLGPQEMSALVSSTPGVGTIRRLHLRLYAPADYLARWNGVFRWQEDVSQGTDASNPAILISSALERKVVSQRQLAEGIGVDRSLLNKVLRGKRGWPEGWLDRAVKWLSSRVADSGQGLTPFGQQDTKGTS